MVELHESKRDPGRREEGGREPLVIQELALDPELVGLFKALVEPFRVRSPDLKLLLQIKVCFDLENHKVSVLGVLVKHACLEP
uniref:Uncharacterized protein n=1 Tax=Lactuca sativa TaxID=4236 RepID=A0A9R1VNK7_LACSA|nr:hypothetical protein LSAT_V11C400167730 [Lactuca sativa]